MEAVDYLQPIGMLVLFFVILYGAYYASRSIGRLQTGRYGNGNLTILEAISVGPQKTLQIVKTGNKYMVIGVSKDHITFIRELSPEDLDLEAAKEPEVFGKVLKRIIQKEEKDGKEEQLGEKDQT